MLEILLRNFSFCSNNVEAFCNNFNEYEQNSIYDKYLVTDSFCPRFRTLLGFNLNLNPMFLASAGHIRSAYRSLIVIDLRWSYSV